MSTAIGRKEAATDRIKVPLNSTNSSQASACLSVLMSSNISLMIALAKQRDDMAEPSSLVETQRQGETKWLTLWHQLWESNYGIFSYGLKMFETISKQTIEQFAHEVWYPNSSGRYPTHPNPSGYRLFERRICGVFPQSTGLLTVSNHDSIWRNHAKPLNDFNY